MPVVNVYYTNSDHFKALDVITLKLQAYIAKQLSCGDRSLQPNEVSIRLLKAGGQSMLADVEAEMFAAPYKERVEKQDEICLSVRQFVLDHVEDLKDAQVWLMLQELGHSWQEPK